MQGESDPQHALLVLLAAMSPATQVPVNVLGTLLLALDQQLVTSELESQPFCQQHKASA